MFETLGSCSSRKSMYSFLSPNWTNASAYRWVWSLVATADYRSTTVTHTHTYAQSHTHSCTHRFSLHLVQFGVEQLQLTVPLLQCPLQLLPLSLKTFLLNHSSRLSSSPPDQRPHFIQAILNLTTASWYNILCMAHQEMTEVSVLPVDTIRAHLHKLVFYYGVGDQWNTPELCPRIQQLFPEGDITLCRHGYKHDFVLESANEMAEYCCDKMTS